MNVTVEKFVEAWQKSSSLEALAQELGYNKTQSMQARAYRLRKRGVPLKKFMVHYTISGARLNNLIAIAKKYEEAKP